MYTYKHREISERPLTKWKDSEPKSPLFGTQDYNLSNYSILPIRYFLLESSSFLPTPCQLLELIQLLWTDIVKDLCLLLMPSLHHCKHLYWPQSVLPRWHITGYTKWHDEPSVAQRGQGKHIILTCLNDFVFLSCCHKATDQLIISTFYLIQDDLDIIILWSRFFARMKGFYGSIICSCRIALVF